MITMGFHVVDATVKGFRNRIGLYNRGNSIMGWRVESLNCTLKIGDSVGQEHTGFKV